MDDLKNIELGQICFSPNTIQNYDCPDYVIALLEKLMCELDRVMWNINQEEYDNPFRNTGNSFIGQNFEVHAYNWDEDIEQPYNFKFRDVEISWYKYLGRGCTINGQYPCEKLIEMYNICVGEIRDLESED